jgi:hypothetical protein
MEDHEYEQEDCHHHHLIDLADIFTAIYFLQDAIRDPAEHAGET